MYTLLLTTEGFEKVIVFPCVGQIKVHIMSSNGTQISSEHKVQKLAGVEGQTDAVLLIKGASSFSPSNPNLERRM